MRQISNGSSHNPTHRRVHGSMMGSCTVLHGRKKWCYVSRVDNLSRLSKNPAQQVEFREFRPRAEIKAERSFGGERHDPSCYISSAVLVEQAFTAYLKSCSVLGAESSLGETCDNSSPNFKSLSCFPHCEKKFAGSLQSQH